MTQEDEVREGPAPEETAPEGLTAEELVRTARGGEQPAEGTPAAEPGAGVPAAGESAAEESPAGESPGAEADEPRAEEPAAEAAATEAATSTASPDEEEKHGRHRSTRPGWITRSHLLVAVLCAALGFAIVVQVRQTHADEYSLLRQNELVALLDEITQRNDQLEAEQAQLVLDRNDLEAGVGASEVAERNATIQSVLAGTVPVTGPGVEITVREGDSMIPVSAWVNLVEELRNSGAEAIEIGSVRFGAASWFAEEDGHVVVDGVPIGSAVTVRAIGDSQALEGGVQFRGGALPTLRLYGAVTSVESVRNLTISSVRTLQAPEIAQPAPEESREAG